MKTTFTCKSPGSELLALVFIGQRDKIRFSLCPFFVIRWSDVFCIKASLCKLLEVYFYVINCSKSVDLRGFFNDTNSDMHEEPWAIYNSNTITCYGEIVLVSHSVKSWFIKQYYGMPGNGVYGIYHNTNKQQCIFIHNIQATESCFLERDYSRATFTRVLCSQERLDQVTLCHVLMKPD